MKKVHIIVIALVILFFQTATTLAVTVKDLENNRANVENKIHDIKTQKGQQQARAGELLNEAESMIDDLDEKEKELADLTENLTGIIAYINEVQGSIVEAEANLRRREQEAGERLRVMYENSNKTIFDLFLESGDITEFFEKLEIYKMVAQKDNEVIGELDIAREELRAKKSMLNGDYEGLVAQINQTREDLNSLRLTRAELLQQVSLAQEQIRALSSLEDKLEQESRDLAARIKNMQSSAKYVGGTFIWPLPSDHTIHSYFGRRLHPIYGVYKMHTGLDIGGAYGASIIAANSGTVIYSGYESGYGYHIVVDHGGGLSTLYAHASKLLVSKGTYVKQGQTIAYVGSTGASTGPHLHFEIRINGDPVNPLNYYNKQ